MRIGLKLTRLTAVDLAAVALTAGLVFALPDAARAGFEDGAAAYQQGDYARALQEWTPLAEKGNQQAQYNIGYMHFNGIGVPKEPTQAVRWFTMAAEQGDAAAQMSLGVMYGTGQGVPRDYSKAYIWLTLAAARLPYGEDRDQAVKDRDIVSAKMTRAQITEALGQALNWSPKSNGATATQTASTGTPQVTPAAGSPVIPAPSNGISGSIGAAPGSQIAVASQAASDAEAKAAAQAKAAEEARLAAEAKAAAETEARIAAEAKAAAQAKAAEEARIAAEAKAVEQAKAAEEAKKAAEAKAQQQAQQQAAADAQMSVPPAPKATQTAALTTAGDGYLVQIASLRSYEAAQTAWSRIQRRHADLLSGMEPVLQPIAIGADAEFD